MARKSTTEVLGDLHAGLAEWFMDKLVSGEMTVADAVSYTHLTLPTILLV